MQQRVHRIRIGPHSHSNRASIRAPGQPWGASAETRHNTMNNNLTTSMASLTSHSGITTTRKNGSSMDTEPGSSTSASLSSSRPLPLPLLTLLPVSSGRASAGGEWSAPCAGTENLHGPVIPWHDKLECVPLPLFVWAVAPNLLEPPMTEPHHSCFLCVDCHKVPVNGRGDSAGHFYCLPCIQTKLKQHSTSSSLSSSSAPSSDVSVADNDRDDVGERLIFNCSHPTENDNGGVTGHSHEVDVRKMFPLPYNQVVNKSKVHCPNQQPQQPPSPSQTELDLQLNATIDGAAVPVSGVVTASSPLVETPCDVVSFPSCTWLGLVNQLDAHLANCPSQQIRCRYANDGCNLSYPRQYMEEHVTTCEFRPVTCAFCSLSLLFRDLDQHQQVSCEHFPLVCPQRCVVKVSRQQRSKHVREECDETVLPCDFAGNGCPSTMPRRAMAANKDECEYRNVVCSYCKLTIVLRTKNVHESDQCQKCPYPCPQKCPTMVTREDQQHHFGTMCPFTLLECEYTAHHWGCPLIARQDMAAHVASVGGLQDHAQRSIQYQQQQQQQRLQIQQQLAAVTTLSEQRQQLVDQVQAEKQHLMGNAVLLQKLNSGDPATIRPLVGLTANGSHDDDDHGSIGDGNGKAEALDKFSCDSFQMKMPYLSVHRGHPGRVDSATCVCAGGRWSLQCELNSASNRHRLVLVLEMDDPVDVFWRFVFQPRSQDGENYHPLLMTAPLHQTLSAVGIGHRNWGLNDMLSTVTPPVTVEEFEKHYVGAHDHKMLVQVVMAKQKTTHDLPDEEDD